MQPEPNTVPIWVEIYAWKEVMNEKFNSLEKFVERNDVQNVTKDLDSWKAHFEKKLASAEKRIEKVEGRATQLETNFLNQQSLAEIKKSAKKIWKSELQRPKYYITGCFIVMLFIVIFWVTAGFMKIHVTTTCTSQDSP